MATRLRTNSNTWIRGILHNKLYDVCLNLGCRTDEDQEGGKYAEYFKWNKMIKVDMEIFPGVDIVAKAQQLPLANKSVNFIFCNWVIYYLTNEDRIKAVSEMKRILRPKGEILISYWSLDIKDIKWIRELLSKDFKIFSVWHMDCIEELDKRNGFAEIFYGVIK